MTWSVIEIDKKVHEFSCSCPTMLVEVTSTSSRTRFRARSDNGEENAIRHMQLHDDSPTFSTCATTTACESCFVMQDFAVTAVALADRGWKSIVELYCFFAIISRLFVSIDHSVLLFTISRLAESENKFGSRPTLFSSSTAYHRFGAIIDKKKRRMSVETADDNNFRDCISLWQTSFADAQRDIEIQDLMIHSFVANDFMHPIRLFINFFLFLHLVSGKNDARRFALHSWDNRLEGLIVNSKASLISMRDTFVVSPFAGNSCKSRKWTTRFTFDIRREIVMQWTGFRVNCGWSTRRCITKQRFPVLV